VRNTKYYQPREDFKPVGFFPMDQDEAPEAGTTFVVRFSAPGRDVFREVKRAAGQVNPAIVIKFEVLRQPLDDSLQRDRLMASLASGFGLLKGLLATVGPYGVIAYLVERDRDSDGKHQPRSAT
jgi:hypothetical protein